MDDVVADLRSIGANAKVLAQFVLGSKLALWLSAGVFALLNVTALLVIPRASLGEAVFFIFAYVTLVWLCWMMAFVVFVVSGKGSWLVLVETPFVLLATFGVCSGLAG